MGKKSAIVIALCMVLAVIIACVIASFANSSPSVGVCTNGHFYKEQSRTKPTCTSVGEKVLVCSVCGKMKAEKIAMRSHDYELISTEQPTCTQDGKNKYKCKSCGITGEEKLEKTHSYIDATCTEPSKCEYCGETKGEPLYHKEDGLCCSRCGEVLREIKYSGHGNDVISNVSVPRGIYRVVLTNSGAEHFSVVTYDENGNYGDLLANDYGKPYYGEAIYRDGKAYKTDGWTFEISSKSDWTIEVVQITDVASSNFSGKGTKVTDFFTGEGLATVTMTNIGFEHFSVVVYDEHGKYISLLANDYGASYYGKKTFKFQKGTKYFAVIDSESEWTVDFGQGDTWTDY